MNLWAFGRYKLHLTDREFWHLTLAQFNALAESWQASEQILDYRAALICALIAETNRNHKKRPKPYKPSDFMPRREKRRTLNEEQMKQRLAVITTALGGTQAKPEE